MAGVAFAGEGDGVGFATESYAASAIYATLANLSRVFWRIRRARLMRKIAFRLWDKRDEEMRLVKNTGLGRARNQRRCRGGERKLRYYDAMG
jgi:hypothetical protein